MRLLLVVEAFPNPSETFIVHQANTLIAAGHEVWLLASAPLSSAPVHACVLRHGLPERVWYRPEPAPRWRFWLETISRCGLLPSLQLANPLRHGRLGPSGRLAAATLALPEGHQRFDAILAHFGPNGVLAEALRRAGRISGALVTFYHGVDVGTRSPRALRRKYRMLFAAGDLHLAASGWFHDRLAATVAIPPERLGIHRMGIELPPERSWQPPAPGEPWTIISIGRLVEKKGLDTALQALGRLRREGCPDFIYHIVGEGRLRPHLEDLARQEGLSDLVVFHGWQSQEAIAALLQRTHLALAPSRTAANGDTEACPLSISEALAHGIPVVATRHGGIPEMVLDGRNGRLVDEGDAAGLARAIAACLGDPVATAALARAGRAHIAEHWDIIGLHRDLMARLGALTGQASP